MWTTVLTGSTGGLGKSLVEALHGEENLDLICVYRNQKKFDELLGGKKAIQGYHIKGNDDFSSMLENKRIQKCDGVILILNAFSISPIKRVGDYDSTDIEEFIYGNITRNVLLLNTVVKFCRTTNKKMRIINLDSGAANYPLTGWGNYCSAKAYLNSIISVIALENPDYQIVSVDPGVMDTNMQALIRDTDKSTFDQVEIFKAYKEENRLCNPLEVAIQIKERYIADWKAKNIKEKI